MRCASSRGCELRKSALEDCFEQPLAARTPRQRLIWSRGAVGGSAFRDVCGRHRD